MTMRCPMDGQRFDDDVTLCPIHVSALEPYVEPPAPAEERREPVDPGGGAGGSGRAGASAAAGAGLPEREPWDPAVCWNCGTPSPNPSNTECLDSGCRRPLTPPILVIRFRDGQVEVRHGERAELGRHGAYARVFRGYPNVSRRHAIVGVDESGCAWVEAVPTPNGTWVDGQEIDEAVRVTLRTGGSVRLARDAEGTVTIYRP